MERSTQGAATSGTSNPLGGGGGFGGGPPGGGGFGGGNANEMLLLRQRMLNALGGILTEEQLQKYQAMGSNTAIRPGTVYVIGAKGEPEAKNVRVGLSTDSQTEVISGLNEGDKIIVRARTEQK